MPKYPARNKATGKKVSIKSKSPKLHVTRAGKKTMTKIGIYVLLGVFSIFFIGGITFYKYLTSSYASALSSSQISFNSEFSPSFIYVVVDKFDGENTKLLKFEYTILNEEDKKMISYNVPVDTIIDMPGKIGDERLSKVFTVAGLNSGDSIELGRKLLSRAAFKIFGYKVDKYIIVDSSIDSYMSTALKNGNSASLLPLVTRTELGKHLNTDITLKEFYKLLSFIQSLPTDRIVSSVFNIASEDSMSSLDEDLKDISYASPLAKEALNIAVLNATNTGGFATFGSRVITNNGGRVVAVSNALELKDVSTIIADDPSSATVLLLKRIFGIDRVISKDSAHETYQEAEINRSDITIVLGFDTRDLMY